MNNTRDQVTRFAENLAMLLASGSDLDNAFVALLKSHTDNRFRQTLCVIHDAIRGGEPLHMALIAHPEFFSSYFVGMVRAGDASGDLAGSLKTLATQIEKDALLKSEIKSSLLYPAILIVTMAISLGLIGAVILPQLVTVFESTSQPLSIAGKVIYSLGIFFRQWGSWLILIAVLTPFILWLLRDTLQLRMRLLSLVQRTPGISPLLQKVELARFTETLASLLDSGLPQTQALDIASNTFGSRDYHDKLRHVIKQIEQGQLLGSSMLDAGLVDEVLAHSITAGEHSGQLPTALRELAARLERQFTVASKNLVTIIEPTLILSLGLIIGVIVYAVFSSLQTIGELPL